MLRRPLLAALGRRLVAAPLRVPPVRSPVVTWRGFSSEKAGRDDSDNELEVDYEGILQENRLL